MKKTGSQELFEISELADEDVIRRSTGRSQEGSGTPISNSPRLKIPIRIRGDSSPKVPRIDPVSSRLADSLFNKKFPATYRRLQSAKAENARKHAGSRSPKADENWARDEEICVPRVHIRLPSKTCSNLFFPFRIGPEESVSLPEDVKRRHLIEEKDGETEGKKEDLSFLERNEKRGELVEIKRKKEVRKRLDEELADCTFRPKVSPTPKSGSPSASSMCSISFKRSNSSYSERYQKRKSSLASTPKTQSPVHSSPHPFVFSDQIRVPPPNPESHKPATQSNSHVSKTQKSTFYTPLSPTYIKTAYKSGCDLASLEARFFSMKPNRTDTKSAY